MKHHWTCRKCKHRQPRRTSSRRCENCGEQTRPVKAAPKHDQARQQPDAVYADLQQRVHRTDTSTCALCRGPVKQGNRGLDRDHSHADGGYPRGLLHPLCNKLLGQVERGGFGEQWLWLACGYLGRARIEHERLS
jgi:hypothetical protein